MTGSLAFAGKKGKVGRIQRARGSFSSADDSRGKWNKSGVLSPSDSMKDGDALDPSIGVLPVRESLIRYPGLSCSVRDLLGEMKKHMESMRDCAQTIRDIFKSLSDFREQLTGLFGRIESLERRLDESERLSAPDTIEIHGVPASFRCDGREKIVEILKASLDIDLGVNDISH